MAVTESLALPPASQLWAESMPGGARALRTRPSQHKFARTLTNSGVKFWGSLKQQPTQRLWPTARSQDKIRVLAESLNGVKTRRTSSVDT